MPLAVSHRPACEHADDASNLRNRAVRRALAVNGEHDNRHHADDASDERAVTAQPAHHGTDAAALDGDGSLTCATFGASHATVTRAPPMSTVADTPTSGKPCATGNSTTTEPTGVEHCHGRDDAADAGDDGGTGTGGM